MTPRLALLGALLVGCEPGHVPASDGPNPYLDSGGSAADTADTADSAEEPEEPAIEQIPAAADPAAWLFGLDQVVPVELTLSEESKAALYADPLTYVPATLTIGDVTLEEVAVRIKGRLGSLRTLDQKAAFRVDLNYYREDQTFYGLKALTLNNMVNDYAQLHEITAYDFYRSIGVPAPRVGYAWVQVNGTDYGLYANIETPDDNFLAHNYEDPSGNLYDADYILYPDYTYTLVDFTPSQYHIFELDEGVDVGMADIYAIVEAVQATAGTAAYYEAVGELVDWDHFFRMWATEIWVGQWDGYGYNSNNYRVYFNPEDGKAELIPWGHDWSFNDWGNWTTPVTVLGYYCRQHPDCNADFLEALGEVADAADAWPFAERVAQTAELINPYMKVDPRKELDVATILYYQDYVAAWAKTRSVGVRGLFGISVPTLRFGFVDVGEVALLSSEADLELKGVLHAVDYGGEGATIGGVAFAGAAGPGYTYASNVPDLDGDTAAWTGLETALYTCIYEQVGYDLALSYPVPAGDVTVQLIFFEPAYASWGGRTVDIDVEGATVVSGLDTSTTSAAGGIVYTWRGVVADGALDVVVGGGEGGDGYPILSAAVVTAP